ncbi:MAG: dihydroneopterin aldolase family protein [Candidatus Methanomethylophilaceae archaeon]|jgi:hypothetical protein|nr:dihydroneopterin aldolase family protein [Candidatus Methanomethylophilaceae archaeon]
MPAREEIASAKFACSDRERAVFEAGIKMATIYHQFVGTPVNRDTAPGLEKAISEAIGVQPYVQWADVRIDRSVFPADRDRYSYISLTGDMLDAVVRISLGKWRVTAEMRYDEDLRYPLMYVSSITEE